jgi:mannose-6-phosphate isomerase-like protein (cupin superfamily)
MKILNATRILEGNIIKENETIKIIENKTLKNLTISKTILKPFNKFKGRKHKDAEEICFFFRPAFIEINGEIVLVDAGQAVLIEAGETYNVHNPYSVEVEFTSIFQTNKRKANESKKKHSK